MKVYSNFFSSSPGLEVLLTQGRQGAAESELLCHPPLGLEDRQAAGGLCEEPMKKQRGFRDEMVIS